MGSWLLILLLAATLLPVSAAHAIGAVGSVQRTTSKAAEVRYWTRDRMRAANPLPLPRPRGDALIGGGRHTRNHPASFFSGEVSDHSSYPNTTNGKVFARIPGFGSYACSATVVRAENRSVLFTAGHCVYEPGTGWITHFAFVPSYRDGSRPFGTWVWRNAFAPSEWIRNENFNYDYGAVALSPQNGVRVQSAVGARGLEWNQARRQDYQAFGYPKNKFDGERMWTCESGYEGGDPGYRPPGPNPIAIGCDMGIGASGGGFIIDDRDLNSVASFGYPQHRGILYGPYFDELARRLRATAGGG